MNVFIKNLRLTLKMTLLNGLPMFLLGAGIVTAIQWYLIPQLPSAEGIKEVNMQIPLQVYTKDNVLIAEYGEQRRIPLAIEQMPPLLIKAVLAAEDDRFYEHPGVDLKGLFRAIVMLLKTGKKRQGGSTITMQVARNFFLSHERTFTRKFNEIWLAFQIEKALSKNEILELYLNKIFLGHRAYGVGAAAQIYYGKNLFDLTLAQWAMLAALPKAPSANNPVTNPEDALQRRNYVLERMLKLKYINTDEYEVAVNAPLTAKLHKPASGSNALYAAEMVRSFLIEKLGDDAINNGYKVFTTIDSRLQKKANSALRKTLFDYDKRHGFKGVIDHVSIPYGVVNEDKWAHKILKKYSPQGGLVPSLVLYVSNNSITAYNRKAGRFRIAWQDIAWARSYINENKRSRVPKNAKKVVKRGDVIMARPLFRPNKKVRWRLSQVPEVQGALVALRPNDGAIIAVAGGFDFFHSKFNRATQALRQPGSSFKPFVYSAALAKRVKGQHIFSDSSTILDAPIVFQVRGEVWRPRNFTRKYYGETTLRAALAYSYNASVVRLLNQLGVRYTINHLTKFGFEREKIPKNLTIALGTGEVTPLELTSGFAVFANGGFRVKPYFIDRIEDMDGKVIYSANPLTACHKCPRGVLGSEKDMQSDILVPHTACTQTPRYAPQIISLHNAYTMTSMLKDVIRIGTAHGSRLQRRDIAGKTGTTNDQRDAWFVGYSPDIVTTTWVGFDTPRPLGRQETGGRAALPMWVDFMSAALKGKRAKSFPKPKGYIENRLLTPEPAATEKSSSSSPGSWRKKPSTVIPDQLF